MTSPALNHDVIGNILRFSPDFGTLKNAVLSCHLFHDAFVAYRQFIVSGIHCNELGPVMPQAIRLLEYRALSVQQRRRWDPNDHPERPFYLSDPLSDELIREIQQLRRTAEQYEEIFAKMIGTKLSLQTERGVVLNFGESWRFRRALFRLMLFCDLFKGTDDNDRPLQIGFVESFSSIQLAELYSIWSFVAAFACWCTMRAWTSNQTVYQGECLNHDTMIYLNRCHPLQPELLMGTYLACSNIADVENRPSRFHAGYAIDVILLRRKQGHLLPILHNAPAHYGERWQFLTDVEEALICRDPSACNICRKHVTGPT